MNKILIAALMSAIMVATTPVKAGEIDGRGPFLDNERGAFAGVRLSAELGGADRQLRGGLTLAPTSHSRRGTASRKAMGEGLEISVSPNGAKPVVTLAGERLDRMNLFGRPPKEQANLSTLATIAIVAGVVVIVGGAVFFHMLGEASCVHGDGGDC